jgi:undecaprenyl-diphosphatase
MNIFQAIFLGILEGLTEFLPVSSTFHLLIATKLLGLPQTEFSKFFDVFIQAGAIAAVLVLFAKEWFAHKEVLKKVVVSFLPTALVGFLLHSVIKDVFFESFQMMIVVFIGVGVIFLLLERWFKKGSPLKKTAEDVTYLHAVMIGFAQALAVFPGVSRAGAVMIAMMVMGYRRDEAAKYSFTLAVPTIMAAAGLDVLKMRSELMTTGMNEWTVLVVGSIAAFASALVVMRWFVQFLRHRTFEAFGWYRVLGGALLFFAVR